MSDTVLGTCLVYDPAGLYTGQEGQWQRDLGRYAYATAVAVYLKHCTMRGEAMATCILIERPVLFRVLRT